MPNYDNMLHSLPAAYRADKWVVDLLHAVGSLDEAQREKMLDVTQQLFPGSMTWALDIEERDAGLTATGTLEERRTALIARWRGSGKCDVDLIQRVCDSWQNGEISVGFAEGVILLTFIGSFGIPEPAALAALQEAVDRVIPCHLAVQYLWRWLLVREVDSMTVDELQSHRIDDFAREEVRT